MLIIVKTFATDVVNECEEADGNNSCGFYGTCIDGMGTFECICDPGYMGNHCEIGKTCLHMLLKIPIIVDLG